MKRLWITGFFWITITYSIAYMLMSMASSNLNWYQFLLVMLLLPGILVILGLIILARPGSMNSTEILEVIKYILWLIYHTITSLFRRKDNDNS
ncbi:hypothetical protein SAMN05428988_4943 [Chitinophaga sp. YR573]|nr:hypothetical protein SAMN05428988_4943 [Chitinophaga sp. YR573]